MKPAARRKLRKTAQLQSTLPPGPDLTPRDLRSWQRTLYAAVTRPLAPGDLAQRRWFDGSSSARALAKLIKPSATLQPIERVEIYNRMYWFRLLECLATDFAGLRALLGDESFWKLAEAYLRAHPSHSFTLRNLGAKMPRFIQLQPRWTRPHTAAARDLARFEWAQIVAFDEGRLAPLTPRKLKSLNPAKLRLRLQPYLTLLTTHHAVDEYALAVKNDNALRATASHAATERTVSTSEKIALVRTARLHLAVHRVDNQLYYKRLEPEAARVLRSLDAAQTLPDACAHGFAHSSLSPEAQAEKIKDWFSLWMRLGWLCLRA